MRVVVFVRVLHAVENHLVDLFGEHGGQGSTQGRAIRETCDAASGGGLVPRNIKMGRTPVPQQPIRVYGLCDPHHVPRDEGGADELGRGVSIALLLADAAVDPASFPQPTQRCVRVVGGPRLDIYLTNVVGVGGADETGSLAGTADITASVSFLSLAARCSDGKAYRGSKPRRSYSPPLSLEQGKHISTYHLSQGHIFNLHLQQRAQRHGIVTSWRPRPPKVELDAPP